MFKEHKTERSIPRSGINYWRNVRYMDDGVTCYQCLLCKESWHAAEAPGYTWSGHDPDHAEGEYTPSWKFCPFCATQWVGEMQSPRKRALERKIDEHTWKFRQEPKLEKRWTIEYSSFSTQWQWRNTRCLQSYHTYKDAYRILKQFREEEDERSRDIENHFLEYDERLKERYRAILK